MFPVYFFIFAYSIGRILSTLNFASGEKFNPIFNVPYDCVHRTFSLLNIHWGQILFITAITVICNLRGVLHLIWISCKCFAWWIICGGGRNAVLVLSFCAIPYSVGVFLLIVLDDNVSLILCVCLYICTRSYFIDGVVYQSAKQGSLDQWTYHVTSVACQLISKNDSLYGTNGWFILSPMKGSQYCALFFNCRCLLYLSLSCLMLLKPKNIKKGSIVHLTRYYCILARPLKRISFKGVTLTSLINVLFMQKQSIPICNVLDFYQIYATKAYS